MMKIELFYILLTFLLINIFLGTSQDIALAQELDPKNFLSGNEMHDSCKLFVSRPTDINSASTVDLIKSGECYGQVEAIVNMSAAETVHSEYSFCLPKNITKSQLIKVAVLFMDTHPEVLHMPFTYIAMTAFKKAWPCKTN